MKKIKWTIMTLVILMSIGGAFASRPKDGGDCRTQQQYYWNGATYVATGTIGVNYVCENAETSPDVCTYAIIGGVYTPCQQGDYTPVGLQGVPTKVQAKK